MALFLITKDLTCADVLDATRDIAFPESVLDLLSGRMGQTVGGFPRRVRDRVLRGEKPLRGRAGSQLPPADFDQAAAKLEPKLGREPTRQEVLSHLLYPTVFEDWPRISRITPTPAICRRRCTSLAWNPTRKSRSSWKRERRCSSST
jgi:pyruvate carboxylase